MTAWQQLDLLDMAAEDAREARGDVPHTTLYNARFDTARLNAFREADAAFRRYIKEKNR